MQNYSLLPFLDCSCTCFQANAIPGRKQQSQAWICHQVPKPSSQVHKFPPSIILPPSILSPLKSPKVNIILGGVKKVKKSAGTSGSRHLACEHKARRTQCSVCNGGSVCIHGKVFASTANKNTYAKIAVVHHCVLTRDREVSAKSACNE